MPASVDISPIRRTGDWPKTNAYSRGKTGECQPLTLFFGDLRRIGAEPGAENGEGNPEAFNSKRRVLEGRGKRILAGIPPPRGRIRVWNRS
jgi:hypothetical protein